MFSALSTSKQFLLIKKKPKGFTLIELMVVVSIIALVSGLTIPVFSNFAQNQNLRQAQQALESDIITAQNRALSGSNQVISPGVNNQYWVVNVPHNSTDYFVYTTSNPDTSVCTNSPANGGDSGRISNLTRYTLPNATMTSNDNLTNFCIHFDYASGNAYMNPQCATTDASCSEIGVTDGTNCLPVIVNYSGLVETPINGACT